MVRMAKQEIEPDYKVGNRVFVNGGNGTIVAVHGDGRYDVEMAWGAIVTARWTDMAFRG